MTCVGTSHRHFNDGNRGLANVGAAVMKLVLRDQCYLFKIPDGMILRLGLIIQRLIETRRES